MLFAMILRAVNAMMANPKDLEVEQCVEWSSSTQDDGPKWIRGFRATSAKDVCIQTKIIVLKQHGNAMQHWLTDEDGMYDLLLMQSDGFESYAHPAHPSPFPPKKTLPSYKEIMVTIFMLILISMEN